MKILIIALALAGCGDNIHRPLTYTDPPNGGALRLVWNVTSTSTSTALDLIVGDHVLTGYSVGFDLPLDTSKVVLGTFTPGKVLVPGGPPIAALATIPTTGPLAGMLVTAQSQKASGAGAIAGDTTLHPGDILYTIRFDLVDGAPNGVVFDGTASEFRLPSGGLRNRAGLTIVEPKDVAIGRLEVIRQ